MGDEVISRDRGSSDVCSFVEVAVPPGYVVHRQDAALVERRSFVFKASDALAPRVKALQRGLEETLVVFRHEGGRVLRRASETNGIFWLQEAQGVHDAFLGEGLHRLLLSLCSVLRVLSQLEVYAALLVPVSPLPGECLLDVCSCDPFLERVTLGLQTKWLAKLSWC